MPAPVFDLPTFGSAPNQYTTEQALEAGINAGFVALWNEIVAKASLTALNRLGVIPLTDIGGTANAITASIPASVVADGVTLNNTSTVSFTPSASNTGSPVTLFVAGDQARPLRGEDGGDIPAGYLKASRFYIAQRFGANWKIISGGATFDDLVAISAILDGKADATTIANALNVATVIPLVSIGGTGNAITADLAANAVAAGVSVGGNVSVRYIPAETNSNDDETDVTLHVSGDEPRAVRTEDGVRLPAGFFTVGRAYTLDRRGAAWRVASGAIGLTDHNQLQNRVRNNFRDSGIIQLVNIGGTADDVTADISGSGTALGVTIGTLSAVKFTAAATNTGEMTLTVAGDIERPLLGNNGQPLDAGEVRNGWAYICRRSGENWRIDAGGVALRDVRNAETRRVQGMSQTGLLTLTNIGGTANEITAELPADAWATGAAVMFWSSAVLIPNNTNTGPVKLTVAGDIERDVLRANGQPLASGDLLWGRPWQLRRVDNAWRVMNLGVTRDQLGSAAFRESAEIIDAQKMAFSTVIHVNCTGTGNAIQAEIAAQLPQIVPQTTGLLRMAPPSANTAPNPTITLGGITRTIYGPEGEDLPAGALKPTRMYILRIVSTTRCRAIVGLDASVDLDPVWQAIDDRATTEALDAIAAIKADQSDLDALETVVEGLLTGTRVVGDWDASTAAFPVARPNSDPIMGGDQWNVTGAGTVDGVTFAGGDILTALADGGGATYAGNWSRRAGTATQADQVGTTTPGRFVQAVLDDLEHRNALIDAGTWYLSRYLHPADFVAALAGDTAAQDEARVTAAIRAMFDDVMTWWSAGNYRRAIVDLPPCALAINDELFSETFCQRLWDMTGAANGANRMIIRAPCTDLRVKNWVARAAVRTSGMYADQDILSAVPKVVFRWELPLVNSFFPDIEGTLIISGDQNIATDPVGMKLLSVHKPVIRGLRIRRLMNHMLMVENSMNGDLENLDLFWGGYQPTEFGGTWGHMPATVRFSNVGAVVTATEAVFTADHAGRDFCLARSGAPDQGTRLNFWSQILSVDSPTQVTLAEAPVANVSNTTASFEAMRVSGSTGSPTWQMSAAIDGDLSGRYVTIIGANPSHAAGNNGTLNTWIVSHDGDEIVTEHAPRANVAGALLVFSPLLWADTFGAASVRNDNLGLPNIRCESTGGAINACVPAMLGNNGLMVFENAKFHGAAASQNNFGGSPAGAIFGAARGVMFDGSIEQSCHSRRWGAAMFVGDQMMIDLRGKITAFSDDDGGALIYIDPSVAPENAEVCIRWGITPPSSAFPQATQVPVRYGANGRPGMVLSFGSERIMRGAQSLLPTRAGLMVADEFWVGDQPGLTGEIVVGGQTFTFEKGILVGIA